MPHTPGPWKIAFGGMPQDDYAVIGSPHSDRAVCNLEPRDYSLANARLIAAAPALLEVLEDIAIKAKRQRERLSWLLDLLPDNFELRTALNENALIVNEARAAIAAARGN